MMVIFSYVSWLHSKGIKANLVVNETPKVGVPTIARSVPNGYTKIIKSMTPGSGVLLVLSGVTLLVI